MPGSRLRRALRTGALQYRGQATVQIGGFDRFGEKRIEARLSGNVRVAAPPRGGEEDQPCSGDSGIGTDRQSKVDSVHLRHAVIQDRQRIRHSRISRAPELGKSIGSSSAGPSVQTPPPERVLQDDAVGVVVIDQERGETGKPRPAVHGHSGSGLRLPE